MGGARRDLADHAVIDGLAGLLVRAAKEGIGSRRHTQLLLLRQLLQVLGLGHRKRQRLFRVDMFPGLKNLLRHFEMCRRYREIDDNLDIIVLQQVFHRLRLNVKLVAAGFRRRHVDIRHGANLEALEQRREFQIGGRDIAAADNADAQCLAHGITSNLVDVSK